ncbi:fasciclin-like arabinogalactan protein 4, partial [Trifolium pratense]
DVYLLNISTINSSVVEIETPIVHHSIVTRPVYYRQPIAIYTVSKVLLPKELFGIHKLQYDDAPPSKLGPQLPNDSASGLQNSNSGLQNSSHRNESL